MKRLMTVLLVLAMACGFSTVSRAANPENVTVRVTITSSLDITLVSGSLSDFGSLAPGAPASVSATSATVKNNGSGVDETLTMYADSPTGWTAGSSTAHNTYVLEASVHGSQPTAGDFTGSSNDNVLGEDAGNEKTASGSVFTIDGSATGASVPYGETRAIWFNFQPPSTSDLTGQQDITVTITAIQG